MDIKSVYIKKIGQRGNLTVWQVDGNKIRNSFGIEFTNAGQSLHFQFIPKNEIWIDIEASPGETRYFTDHTLTEWRLMSHGLDYISATDIADKKEISERMKNKEIKEFSKEKYSKVIEHIHKILLGKTTDGVSVWEIDGSIVRSIFDVEYTEGGHDFVYKFVPEGEVWIDDDITHFERPYIILHELHERDLMKKGLTYPEAHYGTSLIEGASAIEWEARHNPKKLKESLGLLGWRY